MSLILVISSGFRAVQSSWPVRLECSKTSGPKMMSARRQASNVQAFSGAIAVRYGSLAARDMGSTSWVTFGMRVLFRASTGSMVRPGRGCAGDTDALAIPCKILSVLSSKSIVWNGKRWGGDVGGESTIFCWSVRTPFSIFRESSIISDTLFFKSTSISILFFKSRRYSWRALLSCCKVLISLSYLARNSVKATCIDAESQWHDWGCWRSCCGWKDSVPTDTPLLSNGLKSAVSICVDFVWCNDNVCVHAVVTGSPSWMSAEGSTLMSPAVNAGRASWSAWSKDSSSTASSQSWKKIL